MIDRQSDGNLIACPPAMIVQPSRVELAEKLKNSRSALADQSELYELENVAQL